jgi:WD40 repeat protein
VLADREVAALQGHAVTVRSLAFSADGQRLASGSFDKTVKVWDLKNRAEVHTILGHDHAPCAVAFSPDGRLLASTDEGGVVKVWDAARGAGPLRFAVPSSQRGIDQVAFSPDGRALAGLGHGVVAVRAGPGRWEWRAPRAGAQPAMLAFSPDGRRLAGGCADQSVGVWEWESGRELLRLPGHRSRMGTGSFSRDGRRLVTVAPTGCSPGLQWGRATSRHRSQGQDRSPVGRGDGSGDAHRATAWPGCAERGPWPGRPMPGRDPPHPFSSDRHRATGEAGRAANGRCSPRPGALR